MESQEVFEEAPVMPATGPENWSGVEVTGLVENGQVLTIDDLSQLPQEETSQDLKCYDGWIAPGQRWAGVPVSAILDRAAASPDAAFVTFSYGEFSNTLSVEEAREPGTLLALQLNGKPVPHGNGGPLRLVAPGKMGPSYVKWVERVAITKEDPRE